MCGNCGAFASGALGCVQAQVELGKKNLGRHFFTIFITLLLSQQAWAVKVPGEEWDTAHCLNSLSEDHCEDNALCEDVSPQLEVSSDEHPLPLLACYGIIESS